MKKPLSTTDHNRDVYGMRYVYPVVSRRAGGISIGINLNTNNACNWRCIYCNVPDLIRGKPEPIDLSLLEAELRQLINEILHGDFMQRYVEPNDRTLQDIAFSGNGEPTSAPEFPEVIHIVKQVLSDFALLNTIKIRLITNGSMMHQEDVLQALENMAACNGEVWFKLDAGTQAGIKTVNDVVLSVDSHLKRLIACAKVCPSFVQTCLFELDENPPSPADIEAYIEQICKVKDHIKGVHLYGIARQSMQPEAARLSRLPADFLEAVANRVRENNVKVYVNP